MQTKTVLKQHDEHSYRLLIEAATGYAIFMLDLEGVVVSWNTGAQRLLGYKEGEIIGKSGFLIFTNEDRASGAHVRELETARLRGQAEDDRWHVKKTAHNFLPRAWFFL
jgi:PAS domain S-box-containing protein